MRSDSQFLDAIQTSFKAFISSGTSRSNAKLKPLHGAIAADIAQRLGDGYRVWALGHDADKEKKIEGRYIDKRVDITITDAATQRPRAGIAVKFVMQNYAQNANNYFENMLGETANIRAASCPYFQVFIILDRLPYYKRSGILSGWETFTAHNMQKYLALAADNADRYMHTPNKTLIYVAHLTPEAPDDTPTKAAYMDFYRSHLPQLQVRAATPPHADLPTDGTVILNDYATFIDKVYYTVKAR